MFYKIDKENGLEAKYDLGGNYYKTDFNSNILYYYTPASSIICFTANSYTYCIFVLSLSANHMGGHQN